MSALIHVNVGAPAWTRVQHETTSLRDIQAEEAQAAAKGIYIVLYILLFIYVFIFLCCIYHISVYLLSVLWFFETCLFAYVPQ